MTDHDELFVITAEECGELTQECMKAVRFGVDDARREYLTKEAGDLLCMVVLMVEKGVIAEQDLHHQVGAKREKLKLYSDLIDD